MNQSLSNRSLLGRPVADGILTDTRAKIEAMRDKGWPAKLVSISIGNIPSVSLYVRNQAKGAARASIQFEERILCRIQFPALRCWVSLKR